ncbi:MAG: hypothetical protein EXS32_16620 [Opitutus sp.]|nr:hypothetical protein [Opitutus sp.]
MSPDIGIRWRQRLPPCARYFNEWRAERDLQSMPVVNTHGVICRDDLLFEIELDACAAASRKVWW